MPISIDRREVIEGTQVQGTGESIAYVIRTADLNTSGAYVNPTSVSTVNAYSVHPDTWALTDVSGTALSGTASLSGRDITLPLFVAGNVTAGQLHKIRAIYVSGGQTLEAIVYVLPKT